MLLGKLSLLAFATCAVGNTLDYATAESGNPFVQGWYRDPDVAYYNGTYWVYATTSNACEWKPSRRVPG
jgi:hypothetical protein